MLSAGALAEATRAALSSGSSQESLQLVIALAVDTAPCDQASITMLGPRQIMQTVASSDDRITKADLLQYQLDEGPCLDAAQSDEIIVVDDMAAERRWPRWAPLAAGLGIGGLAALLLRTDTALGTLNLYSEQPRDYDDLDLEAARVVAAHASVVLAHTRTTQYLRRGMENRSLVGQAQGMLMARYRLTPEQAFAVLRRYSQHANTKITVLAEELTRTGRLPQLEPHIYASRQ